jgi:hypothetical protein
VSFSSACLISPELPMGTEPGSSDTKLLWALEEERLEEGRLVEGIWRRLYSKEVAGLGPGP